MTRIRRTVDDSVSVTLTDAEFIAISRLEADLLGALAERLTSVADGDAAHDRMFPDAYPDDVEASIEFHALTDIDLVTAKSDAARAVMDAFIAAEPTVSTSSWRRASPRTVTCGPELALALLRNLTDLRLMVADRLGISDDGEPDGRGDPEDHIVYWWLGETQELLVEALGASELDGPSDA